MTIRYRLLRWFASIAVASATTCCLAQEADNSDQYYVAISDTLFPDARGWQSVAAAPSLSREQVRKMMESLGQAVSDSELERDFECLFDADSLETVQASSFHVIDIDHDYRPDIIYSGRTRCGEGSLTIIWYKTSSGYAVKQAVAYQGTLLRISPDGTKGTSVTKGCCAENQDWHFSGELASLGEGSGVVVLKTTVLPSTRFEQPRTFSTRARAYLLSRPGVLDSHDRSCEEYSLTNGKYLAKSQGVALGSTQFGTRQWLFVRMLTKSSDPNPAC